MSFVSFPCYWGTTTHCPLNNVYVYIYIQSMNNISYCFEGFIKIWMGQRYFILHLACFTQCCILFEICLCWHKNICIYISVSVSGCLQVILWCFMYECTTFWFYLACWYVFSLLQVCCNFQCTSAKISSWDPYINSVTRVRQDKWGNSNIREVKWLH